MPALKLPPVAPLLAWGWPEQEVEFSPRELQKPVEHVPQPSHPRVRVRKAAGIAKAGYPVPMLRRHLCKRDSCPFPAFAQDAGPLPPSGSAGQDVFFG